jgi:antitoxin component YwqK of YwqJK toxin-antitoxin module
MKKILVVLSITAVVLSGCNEVSNEKANNEVQKKETVAKVEKKTVDIVKLGDDERAITKYANGQPRLVLRFEGEGDKEISVYQKEFFENGQVSKEGPMKDGKRNGDWKSYFKTGELWSKGSYLNGRNNGPTTAYYKSGKVKYEGMYKNGRKSGVWKFFNEQGELTETKNY